MAKGKGEGNGKGKAEAVATVGAKAALEARFSAAIRGGGRDGSGAGAGAAAGVCAGAGLRPLGDAQEAAGGRPSRQAALFESARDDMRRAHLAAQADQLQQVADDATVDQFIRHAESGLFGGDEDEVDYPYVCDGDY